MRPGKRFAADERAIEGLPVRLVIALVVGVAALAVMMQMLNGVNGLAVNEVDARPHPEVIGPGTDNVTVQVVDANGEPVTGATVVVSGDGAGLANGPETGQTNGNGNATVTLTASLGQNQDQGTLEISIKPPAGSQYTDRRTNTRILVVEGGTGDDPKTDE